MTDSNMKTEQNVNNSLLNNLQLFHPFNEGLYGLLFRSHGGERRRSLNPRMSMRASFPALDNCSPTFSPFDSSHSLNEKSMKENGKLVKLK